MPELSLEDRFDIQQLYARYCHALDLNDIDGWLECWAENGEMVSGGASTVGHGALRASAEATHKRRREAGTDGRHWITNIVVNPADDGASGTCYLMFVRVGTGTEGLAEPRSTGVYRDEIVRDKGRWTFQRRTVQSP